MASVDFLKWFAPEGPWCLVAIRVDRKGIQGKTFRPGQEQAVESWLSEVGQDHNIYFTVNPVARDLETKPGRSDILSMSWLHVDVDPRVGEDIDDEQERIKKNLTNFKPTPSCVIFSGGGYQAFWRLKDPVPINGQEQAYEEAKRFNLQLELLLGGDSCHNVDRIMRLPGTMNRPDRKKREKGRKTVEAVVHFQNDNVYDISQFTAAPQVQGADAGFSGQTVRISGNVVRTADLNDLPVGDLCKVVIAQGMDPDEPTKWDSRSEPLFWVCCELVRADVDDDTIFGIITDPVWSISSSVLDKGSGAHDYAVRQIERAREEAVNPWLRRLNEQFAVVMLGGKTRILTEREETLGTGARRTRVHYMTFADFENFHMNKKVVSATASGNPTEIPVGKWWLTHAKRREYSNVIFSPEKEVPGAYNLWRGFAYNAMPGDCSAYLEHVFENICCGRQELYDYLIKWMALAVQHPAQPGHVAIVLRGRQGAGKGVFANTFGELWGRHYLTIRDSVHLFGQFNSHMRDCVVLFADEAFWAGDKKREGMLKSMVTEPTLMVEGKGQDAVLGDNFVHLIMASNESWVVPAGLDDRRFLVLDVSPQKMQDSGFFGRLRAQMSNGGYEALLHHLMTMDLTGFDVRTVPKTEALRDQKMHSLSAEEEWWFGKLGSGRLMGNEWSRRIYTTELCYDFVSYMKSWTASIRSNETKLGMFLKRAIPGGVRRVQVSGEHNVVHMDGETRTVSRPYCYVMPSLEECREHWDREFGGPYDWSSAELVEDDGQARHF